MQQVPLVRSDFAQGQGVEIWRGEAVQIVRRVAENWALILKHTQRLRNKDGFSTCILDEYKAARMKKRRQYLSTTSWWRRGQHSNRLKDRLEKICNVEL